MPGHSHEIACLGREITRVGFETWMALRHAFFSLFDVGGPSGRKECLTSATRTLVQDQGVQQSNKGCTGSFRLEDCIRKHAAGEFTVVIQRDSKKPSAVGAPHWVSHKV